MKKPLLVLTVLALAVLAVAILLRKHDRHLADQTRERIPPPGVSSGSGVGVSPARPSEEVKAPKPSVLDVTLGRGPEKYYRARLAAIDQLGANLSAEDKRALYSYLRDTSEEQRLRPGQAFALKNSILNVLREQETTPEDLTDLLLGLKRDEGQSRVMRDYAIQHLAAWFAKAAPEQQAAILKELQAASSEADRSYSGTALLAMHRIQKENPGVKSDSFTRQIVQLVEDGSANLHSRITAVELSGQLGLQEALPAVQELAGDASQPATLRVAAIGTLGLIGSPTSQALLNKTAHGQETRLQRAALAALNNLQTMHNP